MWAGKEVAINYFLALTGIRSGDGGGGKGNVENYKKKAQHNAFVIYCILDYLTAFF